MKARCKETLEKLIEGNVSNLEFSFLSTPPPVAIEPTDRRRTSRGQGNAMGDGDGGDGGGEGAKDPPWRGAKAHHSLKNLF